MIPIPSIPGGWPVILADPAWSFRDKGSRIAPDQRVGTRVYGSTAGPGGIGGQTMTAYPVLRHYRTMTASEIHALPVAEVAARDSLLFLWTTSTHLIDGTAASVCATWGYIPKATMVWVKCRAGSGLEWPRVQIGMGHYVRNAHELIVIARRGRARVAKRDVPSVIFAPRSRHSAKPAESYAAIERLTGDVPRLELFARGMPRPGWTGWGDEFGLTREVAA